MPDLWRRAEHTGPGGRKCPCCGREASNRTIRTRLKCDLTKELSMPENGVDPDDLWPMRDPVTDEDVAEDLDDIFEGIREDLENLDTKDLANLTLLLAQHDARFPQFRALCTSLTNLMTHKEAHQ